MSDESPSCNVGLRFVHVNTLMYLTFRTIIRKNGTYVLSLASRVTLTMIMLATSLLESMPLMLGFLLEVRSGPDKAV